MTPTSERGAAVGENAEHRLTWTCSCGVSGAGVPRPRHLPLPSPELTYAALEVVEDMRACLRRIDGGWRVDRVFDRNGCWARWDGAEDVKAVVTEPMTEHERNVMKWLRRPLVAAPVGSTDIQCAYCANEIEGGPGGWHDLRRFEVCTGDSPTTFHEPAPRDGRPS